MSNWIDAEAHASRALDMYERGRLGEAEAELRKAIALSPEHAEWHYTLALTLESAGRDAAALDAFEHAAGMLPGELEPALSAGILCNRIGAWRRAIRWLDRAMQCDPSCEDVYAQKIESHRRLGEHDEAESNFYLAQVNLDQPGTPCLAAIAESLIDRRQWRRAEWCLREAIDRVPPWPRLRARLAAVMAATGRPQQAVRCYLRELQGDPGCIETLLDLADLLVDLDRGREAAEKLRRVVEIEPSNVEARFRLAEIARMRGDLESSRHDLERVMKLDVAYPGVRPAMAEILLRLDRPGDARRVLQEELATAPDTTARDITSSIHLGTLLADAGMPDEGAVILGEHLEEGADDPDLLRALARARLLRGDRDGGIEASRLVLGLEPHCVRSMHNLALAALEDGRLRESWRWIRRGLRDHPSDKGLRGLRLRCLAAFPRHLLGMSA